MPILKERKILKVFHADRHRLFRDNFKNVIKDHPFIIIGEADNTKDMLSGLAAHKPDLLITAHLLIDAEATDFLPIIKEKFPDLKILMITMLAQRYYLRRCLGLLDGMISKGSEKENVLKAINAVVNDRLYFVLPEISNPFINKNSKKEKLWKRLLYPLKRKSFHLQKN